MKILVATDMSPAGDVAVRVADRRAREGSGTLGIVHVVPDLRPISPLFPQGHLREVGVVPDVVRAAHDALARRTTELTGRTDDEVTLFTEEGDPYVEIVQRAEEWGAELVVVGGKTEPGLLRSLLGGVAQKVVRYAHVPVMVARALREKGNVLAATDLSDPSLPAVAAGLREARLRGGTFTVLHVVPPLAGGGDFGPRAAVTAVSTPAVAAEEQRTREAIEARLREVLAGLGAPDTAVRVVVGSPAPAILEYAAELDAELVVVGARGRTGLARVVLGSVAEEVVRSAHVSVLAVRLSPEVG